MHMIIEQQCIKRRLLYDRRCTYYTQHEYSKKISTNRSKTEHIIFYIKHRSECYCYLKTIGKSKKYTVNVAGFEHVSICTVKLKTIGLIINKKSFIRQCKPMLWIPNTLNLDPDPEFWPNLDPDPELYYQFLKKISK